MNTGDKSSQEIIGVVDFFKSIDRTEFSDWVSVDISLRFLLPSQDFSGKVLEVTAKEEEFASFRVEKQFGWTQLKTIVLFNCVSVTWICLFTLDQAWGCSAPIHTEGDNISSQKKLACLGEINCAVPYKMKGDVPAILSYPTIHVFVQQTISAVGQGFSRCLLLRDH